jgi:pimeloyl-ACP methyl ester carboxylesterase
VRIAVLISASLTAAVLAIAAGPAGACAADPDGPCLEDPAVAVVKGDIWIDYDLDSHRAATGMESGWQGVPRVYADLDHDGTRDPGEPQDDGETNGKFALPVDTRLLHGETRADIRFSFVGIGQDPAWDFAFKCLAPAAGCVRTVEVNAGEETTGVDFPVVGPGQINGMIWDDKDDDGHREEGEDGVEQLAVFIDDDRDGERDPGEPYSHKTNVTGKYILPVPTRYVVAGGDLPPVVLERRNGVDCSAPSECAVTGLRVRPGTVTDVQHGVARPVVIFLHGYGGSRIACGNKPLWFSVLSGNLGLVGPDLWDMRLGRDGRGLSRAAGGSECSEHAGVTGLLRDVAGGDIYGGASDHFKDIAWPGRAYDYVWDWRKSPEDAVAGLDALVEKARCGGEPPCDAKVVRRVSLVGHSMGGLVIRHYIEDDARADKVQRIVTVGTPYWGSPKTIFPVAAGVEVPMFSEMDALLDNGGLKAASRSFPGHFALMPAFGYGPWLSVAGMNGGRPLDIDGVEEYLRRIGADPMLYTRGASEHGRVLDHYRDHDIDYQVIVGGGLPSIGSVYLRNGIQDEATIRWVTGDETVPAFSGAHDTPRDRLHYVCGISHVPLTTDPQTTRLMDDFVIRGEPMRDEQAECPYQARELTTYARDLSDLAGASAGPKQPQVLAGGRSYSLDEAERAKLVQVVTYGGATTIVAMAGADVRVQLPAGATAKVRDLTEKGASRPRAYGPFAGGGGAVALGGSGAVTADGKAVKPAKADTRAPRTAARVKRLPGGKVRLTLKARDASSKVAATYVTVGAKRTAYRKPLVMPAKRLAKLRYGSVDVWGNAEAARKAPRPGR